MRMMLAGVAHVSQMSNPKAGTGSGGDRCCEAVAAMLLCSFVDKSADPEQEMYRITEAWNSGADVSGLESAAKIEETISQASTGAITFAGLVQSVEAVKAAVERGHVAIISVNDYRQLRTFDGGNPYQWPESTQPPAGHVLTAIGFDDDYQGHGQTIIVMDPLRSIDGQPYDYSAASVSAAGWASLTEVEAPSLLPPAPPAPTTHSYTVERGDSLWYIAIKEYNLSSDNAAEIESRVKALYALNAGVIGSDPDLIRPGMVLVIP